MQFSTLLSLTALATTQVLALGINCRGSALCSGNHNAMASIQGFVANITLDRIYSVGEHIACDEFWGTGHCLFIQGGSSNSNPCLYGEQIQTLLGELAAHGCRGCGSIPLNALDAGASDSNDPDEGILTLNYVHDAGCSGLCA